MDKHTTCRPLFRILRRWRQVGTCFGSKTYQDTTRTITAWSSCWSNVSNKFMTYAGFGWNNAVDESATPSRHLRYYRSDGNEDHSGDCRWGAKLQETGGPETRSNARE